MAENNEKTDQVMQALENVMDPELGLNVVELGLIREVDLEGEEAHVKMLLTTPFCPYAGSMVQQVKEQAESVVGKPTEVTIVDEMWDPSMMEDPSLLGMW